MATKWDLIRARRQTDSALRDRIQARENAMPSVADTVVNMLEQGIKITDTIGEGLAQDDASNYLTDLNTYVLQEISNGNMYVDDNGELLSGESLRNRYEERIQDYLSANPIGSNPWKNRLVNEGIQKRKNNDMSQIVAGWTESNSAKAYSSFATYSNNIIDTQVSNTRQFADDTLLSYGIDYDSLTESEKKYYDDASNGDVTSARILAVYLKGRNLKLPSYEIDNFINKNIDAFLNVEFMEDISSAFDINVLKGSMTKADIEKYVTDNIGRITEDIWGYELNSNSKEEKLSLAINKIDQLYSAKEDEVRNMLPGIISSISEMTDNDPSWLPTTNNVNRIIASNSDWDGFDIRFLDAQTRDALQNSLEWNDGIYSMRSLTPALQEIKRDQNMTYVEKEKAKIGFYGSSGTLDRATVFNMFNPSDFITDDGSYADLRKSMYTYDIDYEGDTASLVIKTDNEDTVEYYTQLQAEIEVFNDNGTIGPTLASGIGYSPDMSEQELISAIQNVSLRANSTKEMLMDSGMTEGELSDDVNARKTAIYDSNIAYIEDNIDFVDLGHAITNPMSAKSTQESEQILFNSWISNNSNTIEEALEGVDENLLNDAMLSIIQNLSDSGEINKEAVKESLTALGYSEQIESGLIDKIVDNAGMILSVRSKDHINQIQLPSGISTLINNEYAEYRADFLKWYDHTVKTYGDVKLSDGKTLNEHLTEQEELLARKEHEESVGYGDFTESSDPARYANGESIVNKVAEMASSGTPEAKQQALDFLNQQRMAKAVNQEQYKRALSFINNPGLKKFDDMDFNINDYLKSQFGIDTNSQYYSIVVETAANAVDPTNTLIQIKENVNKAVNESLKNLHIQAYYEQEESKLEFIMDYGLENGSLDGLFTTIERESKKYGYENFTANTDVNGNMISVAGNYLMNYVTEIIDSGLMLDVILGINRSEGSNGPTRSAYSKEDIMGTLLGGVFGVSGYSEDPEKFAQDLGMVIENMNPYDVSMKMKAVESLYAMNKTIKTIRKEYPMFDIKAIDPSTQTLVIENGAYIRPVVTESGSISGFYASWDKNSKDWDYIRGASNSSLKSAYSMFDKNLDNLNRVKASYPIELLEEYSGKIFYYDKKTLGATPSWR